MFRTLLASLMGVVLFAGTAQAAEGPFMVRVRGVYILPANGSDAFTVADITAPKDAIHVSDKLIPEIDFSYFITPNLAAELILTYPQEHDVTVHNTTIGTAAVNNVKIGTATHLPPVLSVQWHFLPDFVVNPYVGVGANLTLFTSNDLTVPVNGAATKLDLDSASIGFSAQVGADIKIAEHIYANLDAKWVTIGSDVKVKANGAKVTHISINPFLLAAGLGYRF